MIVFQKYTEGWKKTGDVLKGEETVTIAVDAEKPGRKLYSMASAIQEAEKRIAAGTTAYRFELNAPPASYVARAIRVKAKTTRPAASLPNRKPKMVRKATKKETGAQRRARLKKLGLCTACGKRKAAAGFCECSACRKYYAEWAKAKAAK